MKTLLDLIAAGLTSVDLSKFSPLEQSKFWKIINIHGERQVFCKSPIEYNGNTFAASPEAKISICYKIISLPKIDSIATYYTFPEYERIQLSKADFKAIADLIEQRENRARDKSYDLLIKANNAKTIEEVETINIDYN